jgi:hypothetical protein
MVYNGFLVTTTLATVAGVTSSSAFIPEAS